MRRHLILPAAALTCGLILPTLALAQQPGAPSRGNLGGGFLEFLATGGRQATTQSPEYYHQPTEPPRGQVRGRGAGYGATALPVQRDPLAEALSRPARRSYYGAPPPDSLSSGYEQRRVRTANVPPDTVDARRSYAPQAEVASRLQRQEVAYDGKEAPGTIIVDTRTRYLYLVEAGGTARRYGVGVGKPGFEWAGAHTVTRKAEWPSWTPPAAMRARKPGLPVRMEGGLDNPLGSRALYLGSSLYRIHGSNEPWTIGRAVSSGCIRMRNQDVEDLYERVGVGTRVVVR